MAEHKLLESNPMYQQLMNMRNSIVAERILDMYCFHPGTVDLAEVMLNGFYKESTELIATIEQNTYGISDPDLESLFKELKEKIAKIGAHKMHSEVNQTMQHIKRRNVQGAMASFHRMKKELDTVKERLDAYITLGYQVKSSMEANGKQKKT